MSNNQIQNIRSQYNNNNYQRNNNRNSFNYGNKNNNRYSSDKIGKIILK